MAAIFDHKLSSWRLSWNITLLAPIYSGVAIYGITYYLQTLVSQRKGPVFMTAFRPLCTLLTAIMGLLILREALHLGSILGAMLIILGLYMTLWGKESERKKKHIERGMGRKIYRDKDNEGWAVFMCERLPNICYWYGSVTYDDKDCSLWLQSKGTLKVEEQQFGPWIRAPLFNSSKKSFVEVKGYEVVNRGVAGMMVSSDAWASHGFPGLHQGFDNTITSCDSHATIENSMVPRCEDGIMDDEEYISSSMKLSETLRAVKDDERVVPNFEEQL
ncbi:hypothetical protein CMV_009235 [Castanea mollissima]|uniref:WAT1-related protein n=1 Tax=Castanea mollissima TaxID=60419 RepID=A0A8J4VR57_9ROSI|nr:hypothetical protein CMV_009235 [Castanea mollissima]